MKIYDRSISLSSEGVIQDAGNFIGTYMETDSKNFDGNWQLYL